MKLLLFFLILLLGSPTLLSAQDLAGKAYYSSHCASGGFDYFLFEGGIAIGLCSGCESIPSVQGGTWKITNDGHIYISLTDAWVGRPDGNTIPPCGSICLYDKYRASHDEISEVLNLPIDLLEQGEEEGCDYIGNHDIISNSPHQFLRTAFVGKYPQASERLLSTADFKGLSISELRIMRNEIFARYGYTFRTKEMKAYFERQAGYISRFDNVDAFLSEIEKKNIELIKKYEAK